MSPNFSQVLRPLFFAAAAVGMGSTQAATPASGSLSGSSKTLSYALDSQALVNASGAQGEYVCDATNPCDNFTLIVNLPAGYVAAHPKDRIRIDAAASPVATDIDMYLLNATGDNKIAESRHNPPTQESILFTPVDGTASYIVRVFPGTPIAGGTVNITLFTDESAGTGGPQLLFIGIAPRYQVFFPPKGSSAEDSNGEYNIGFNPKTGRIMNYAANGGAVWRVTPPERLQPAQLESCTAGWEDVTPTALTLLQALGDPILWTDQKNGRTFASNATSGASSYFAYTDDDGDNWTDASVSPPGSTVDHQTLVTGPYPAGSPFANLAAAAGVDYALYYCAQDIGGPAACQRSDTGGASFGNGVLMYDGATSACSGIHGHGRVASDGTLYVPVRSCGTGNGYASSSDAGLSFTSKQVPGTTKSDEDPSMGIASDDTLYFCGVDGDGHPRVRVSHDKGESWINEYDIGASVGVINAVFPEAYAGDPDRATCGFVGTNTAGNHDALDFNGIWHLYIATTYDGGKTWATVNVTPDDPVQGVGGICRGGTVACMNTPNNRNLLDFNEVTIDDKGRVLFGYDDGCVDNCLNDPTKNSFVAHMRIARQSGGKSLFSAFDVIEPHQPAAACLAGTRDVSGASLVWRIPDNGGAGITAYNIFRASTATGFGTTPVGSTNNPSSYKDTTADTDVPDYFYKITALNSRGESVFSNVVQLPLSAPENICLVPGISILSDKADDVVDGIAPSQGNTPYYDLRGLTMSQPYFADGSYKIAFHLKVGSLSTVPAGTQWPVSFCSPAFPMCTDTNVAISATNKYYTVRMSTSGVSSGAPVFEIVQPNASGTTTTVVAADAASSFQPNGLITIVVKASDIGLTANAAGSERLTTFLSRVRAVQVTPDNMPDSLVGAGVFQTATPLFCAPNTAPLAALTADVTSGLAPLTVRFSGSGMDSDAGDSIVRYTFDFGDGSEMVTQAAPTITHSYSQVGDYGAKLVVRDSRGLSSNNVSTLPIHVLAATAPNNAPNPVLTVNPASGTAPQDVILDGSGSSDPDTGDRVVSYIFGFGDGSASVTQPGSRISHRYSAAGTYVASLKVVDSNGLESTASASRAVTVQAPATMPPETPPPGTTPPPAPLILTNRFGGGSLDAWLLAGLAAAALRRRRKLQPSN